MKKILLTAGITVVSYVILSKMLKNKKTYFYKCIYNGAEKIHSFLDNFLADKSILSNDESKNNMKDESHYFDKNKKTKGTDIKNNEADNMT